MRKIIFNKQIILVMGLPGSGKSTLSQKLLKDIPDSEWINADEVRKIYNDWDFSYSGRIRQSIRMKELAENSSKDFVIIDLVAPLVEMRNNINPDWIVWMDTIDRGRFEDTNKMFVDPEVYDFRVSEQDSEKWSDFISQHIINNQRRPLFDWKKETVQMLGRWQPWHDGHRALFERAIKKTGQVCIMIRDCQGWQGSNPFELKKVIKFIKRDLDPLYQGLYEIVVVPNIVNITYGRDVGYTIEQEHFDKTISSISATDIRNRLGI